MARHGVSGEGKGEGMRCVLGGRDDERWQDFSFLGGRRERRHDMSF